MSFLARTIRARAALSHSSRLASSQPLLARSASTKLDSKKYLKDHREREEDCQLGRACPGWSDRTSTKSCWGEAQLAEYLRHRERRTENHW